MDEGNPRTTNSCYRKRGAEKNLLHTIPENHKLYRETFINRSGPNHRQSRFSFSAVSGLQAIFKKTNLELKHLISHPDKTFFFFFWFVHTIIDLASSRRISSQVKFKKKKKQRLVEDKFVLPMDNTHTCSDNALRITRHTFCIYAMHGWLQQGYF